LKPQYARIKIQNTTSASKFTKVKITNKKTRAVNKILFYGKPVNVFDAVVIQSLPVSSASSAPYRELQKVNHTKMPALK
jgi:hypothetical protein